MWWAFPSLYPTRKLVRKYVGDLCHTITAHNVAKELVAIGYVYWNGGMLDRAVSFPLKPERVLPG